MAVAKELPEIYLCKTAQDRENIKPFTGQKCIMANGDIYICCVAGIWIKIGGDNNNG